MRIGTMARRLATILGAAGGTVVLLAFLIPVSGDTPKNDAADAATASNITGGIRHGEPDRGLAAFLLCSCHRLKVGDSLEISFGVIATKTNDPPPPKRVKVLRPYPPADPDNLSWISVTGPDGKELRYQGEYIDWANAQQEDLVALPQGAFAGQTFAELVPYHYGLRDPGKYRMRWHYAQSSFGEAWSGRLISNEVEIEIIR